MVTRQLYIILLFISACSYILCAEKNYGRTVVRVRGLEACKGPKRNDCCVTKCTVVSPTKIIHDLNITEDIPLSHGRILGVIDGNEVIKVATKKPCDNLLMNAVFRESLNMTDKCTIMKGHYILALEVQQLASRFYNGAFFYGNLTVKSVYYNDKCNFLCSILKLEILPKNKE